jgi:hypothetical protein
MLLTLTGFPFKISILLQAFQSPLTIQIKTFYFHRQNKTKPSRLLFMNKLLLIAFTLMLLTLVSCKRACLSCKQYCFYCVDKKTQSAATKFCANKTNGYAQVDSFKLKYQSDTAFICNFISDERDLCESKNGIDEAEGFFLKQNYFCDPKAE